MSNNVYVIKESLEGISNEKSAKSAAIFSRNTQAVSAAATVGAKILEYNRTIEETKNGPKNIVTFVLEDGMFEFSPNFAAEVISTEEIMRRLRDDDWLRDNPHHPITYMSYALDAYRRLIYAIKDKSPILRIPRGGKESCLLLSLRGDRDYQRRLMKQAKLSDDEIENVIKQLDEGAGK